MAQAASMWVKLGLIDKDFDKGLKKAENSLNRIGNRLSNLGSRITTGFSLPFAVASGAAIKFAMDAVESENLFSVSMGKMADSARAWSEGLRKQLGLNAYEVRQNVGTFNVMLTSMGLTEKAAFDMSKGLTQLAYDMASFYNLKPEEAFQKLQSGISGEVEPLKRLGILVNETTVKNYALNNGIMKQGEQLSETGKVMARYGAIMQATQKAQGDMARTIDSPANKMRILQQEFKQAAIDLGMAFLPAVQSFMTAAKPFIDQLVKIIQWFAKLPEPVRNATVSIIALSVAFGPLLMAIGKISQAISGLIGAFRVLGGAALIGGFKNIGFAIASVAGGAATATEAIGFLSAAFTPFLVGGAIFLGLTAIVNRIKDVAEYRKLLAKDINKITTVSAAEEKVAAQKTQVEARKKDITYQLGQRAFTKGGQLDTKFIENYTMAGMNAPIVQDYIKAKADYDASVKKLNELKKSTIKKTEEPKVTQDLLSSVGPLTVKTKDKDKRTSTDVYKDFTKGIADAKAQSDIFGESFDLLGKQVNLAESAITELIEMGIKPENKILDDVISKYQSYIQQQKSEVDIQGQIQERMDAETKAWERRQTQIDAEIKKQEDIKDIYNSLDSEMKKIANTEKTFGDGYDDLVAKTNLYKSALLSLIGAGEFGTEKFNELLLVYQQLSAEQKDFIDRTEGAKEAEKSLSDATEYLNSLTSEAIPDYEQFAQNLEKIANKKGVLAETGNELRKMADAIRQAGKGVGEKQAAKDFSESIYNDISQSLTSAIKDGLEGGKNAADSFSDYMGDILKQKVYKAMADAILSSSAGQSFTSSIGSIVSGIFGGGTSGKAPAGTNSEGQAINQGNGGLLGSIFSTGKGSLVDNFKSLFSGGGITAFGAMLPQLGLLGLGANLLSGLFGGGKKDSLSVTSDNAKMNIDFAEANFKTITLPASYQQIGKTSNTNSVAPVINVNVNVPGGINSDRELERKMKKIGTTAASEVQKVTEKWSPYTVNGVNSSLIGS